MRDLYRQLGLRSTADDQRIRAALERKRGTMDAQTIEDIETVLLNPDVRPKYDRVRSTLVKIGEARSRLQDVPSRNWTSTIAGDFFRSCAPPNAANGANPPPKDRTTSRGGSPHRIFVAGAIFIGLVVWASQSADPPHRTTSPTRSGDAQSSGADNEDAIDLFEEFGVDPDAPRTFDNSSPLSRTEICYLQERLTLTEEYDGAVDGLDGPGTKSAIESFRSRNEVSAAGASAGVLEAARYYGPERVTRTPADRRPETGRVIDRPGQSTIAPLRVTVAAGADYFVKLVRPEDQRTVISFYVRGGESWETEVPTGRYEIRYAAGQGWYGLPCLFGEDTVTAKADQLLSFTRNGQYVEGHSIRLILQRGGNLGRVELPVAAF